MNANVSGSIHERFNPQREIGYEHEGMLLSYDEVRKLNIEELLESTYQIH